MANVARTLSLACLLTLAPATLLAQTTGSPPESGAAAPTPAVAAANVPAAELETGETLGEGWTLTAIDHHPEFLRYTFERAGESTVVEVTYPRDGGDGVATQNYLVQGAPGHLPEESLVSAVAARMAALDREGYAPLVRRTGSGTPGAGGGTGGAAEQVQTEAATRSYTAIILAVLGALVLLRIGMRLRDMAKRRGEQGGGDSST